MDSCKTIYYAHDKDSLDIDYVN